MKQTMISDIAGKLSSLGISYRRGEDSDFAIRAEFLDAGWSTGTQKISYEAFVFLDETQQTAFMYEKTDEIGKGLSFGSSSESYSQSGKTLFRKVKSVQYGLDGKAYEITLDLGAIPKAVKETAKQYGWKFKTVLSRNKAMYPAGYTFMQPQAAPMAQQPIQQQPAPMQAQAAKANNFCSSCGTKLLSNARFCTGCGKKID